MCTIRMSFVKGNDLISMSLSAMYFTHFTHDAHLSMHFHMRQRSFLVGHD